MARPRTPVGAYGSIAVRRRDDRAIAETRIRDADGRIRHVRVTARTAAQARLVLQERLLNRPAFGSTTVLTPQSHFVDLIEVWLADLDLQRLAEGTKQHYRDHDVRDVELVECPQDQHEEQDRVDRSQEGQRDLSELPPARGPVPMPLL